MVRITLFLSLCLACLPGVSSAQADNSQTVVGDYIVHHSIFNSSFLTPEVASVYGLTRGRDRAIANVALTRVENGVHSLGLPTRVSGEVRNLMQQSMPLEFIEIIEGDAAYYLAPFRFSDRETLHFHLQVRIPGLTDAQDIKLTRTLYRD